MFNSFTALHFSTMGQKKKNSLVFGFLFFSWRCNEIDKYVSTSNAYAICTQLSKWKAKWKRSIWLMSMVDSFLCTTGASQYLVYVFFFFVCSLNMQLTFSFAIRYDRILIVFPIFFYGSLAYWLLLMLLFRCPTSVTLLALLFW